MAMALQAEMAMMTPPNPIWLKYPDSKEYVQMGEGVYFRPVAKTEVRLENAEKERWDFQCFLEIAQSVADCFSNDGHQVKLDMQFCEEVWDASAPVPSGIRINWAINELCEVLERTPHAGLGQGYEDVDKEVWQTAKQILLAEMMEIGVTRGLVFSVEPELPDGLMIATSTGIIGGHPVVASPRTQYIVTARSEIGQVSCELWLEVADMAPPRSIVYKKVEKAYHCGEPMTIIPKVEGLVTAWSIRPNLPANMWLDNYTGAIFGLPFEDCPETTWTIIGKNDLGSATTKVTFEIVQAPPYNLRYHADDVSMVIADNKGFCGRQAALTFALHRRICLRPTVDGCVDRFVVKPDLPKGLTMDPETGVISGTPEVEMPVVAYLIMAENKGGSGKTTIPFSVRNMPTAHISYPTFDDLYSVGEVIDCEPLVRGGATTWVSEPPLPGGLSLNAATGRITGVCTEQMEETSFTITASNEVGGTSTVLTFEIIDLPPEGLAYLEVQGEYHMGERMSIEPSLLCGEGNCEFTVNPPLPQGLAIDKHTGVISGRPNEEKDRTCYTIKASNSMGECTFGIEFRTMKKTLQKSTSSLRQGSMLRQGSCLGRNSIMNTGMLGRSGSVLRPQTLARQDSSVDGTPIRGLLAPVPSVAAVIEEGEEEDEEEMTEERKLEKEEAAEIRAAAEAERAEARAMEDYAHTLQNVDNLKDLPQEPDRRNMSWEWMLWAVHRAWLGDPSLTSLNFSGLDIPLPEVEARIFPKLMQALAVSKTLTSLDLSDTQLRAPHGQQLATALKRNSSLQLLNIESNNLGCATMQAVAEALTDNSATNLTTLLCGEQEGLSMFGKQIDQALAEMLEKNSKVTKLGFPVQDPHWKSVVERCLKRNVDSGKRSAKVKPGGKKLGSVQERTLATLTLTKPPATIANAVFKDADEKMNMARIFTSEKKRLPTKEQMQLFAKNRGHPLKYSEVAPLVKAFRKTLLDAISEGEVSVMDSTNKKVSGLMTSWSEKNDRWTVEVDGETGAFLFSSPKEPVLELTDAVASWLAVTGASATE